MKFKLLRTFQVYFFVKDTYAHQWPFLCVKKNSKHFYVPFYRKSSSKFISRSSRPEVFCKKSILRNFAKFTGKQLCQSLFFNNVAGLRLATSLKKRLWRRCFPVNFVKFLRTPFFHRTPLVAASVYRELHIQIKSNFLLIIIFDFMKQNIS